ncbi:MAG: ABC transporter ATP-binding protein [Firmicutes bacterium]|nr:ABC transporter ATP-binding protein [Bacillota bacterium]
MITINNLRKVYNTGAVAVEALKGITLNIENSEFVAVMGPSGSGKSTLMNLLGLLDTATDGTYHLDDQEVSGLDKNQLAELRNRKLGFVFQTFNLIPSLTALKNVELPMLYAGLKPQERRERAIIALDRVGLGERTHHRPNELSGGQNQRVAIARAIVNNPAVIMADEPTGALDTRTGEEIMAIFQQLHQEGATIVLVTHEPEIAQHAQRILRFKDGLLTSDEVVENRTIAFRKEVVG